MDGRSACACAGASRWGALAGILAVYVLVDLEPTTLLPVLLALLTVAMVSDRRAVASATVATAMVVVAMPYLHGDQVSLVAYSMSHLAAVGLVVTLGLYLRAVGDRRGRERASGVRSS